jgi:hypothetical protein
MSVSDVAERLRQPEYTGENRCLPCTVVNVVLAALFALGLSVVLTPAVGLAGFAVGLGLVYLRGYLVPGTPELTERYFPPWLLRLFGKDPIEAIDTSTRSGGSPRAGADREAATAAPGGEARTTAGSDERPDADAATGTGATSESATTGTVVASDDPLAAAGVVTVDGTGLTPAFREAWADRVATVDEAGVEPADVAAVYGASEARETGDRSFVLDGSKSVRWGSRAALVADVAAAALLEERLDEWDDSDRDRRQSVLLGLRLRLDRCPGCGGDVTYSQERVDPCCQKPHLVADAMCESCGAVVADAAVVDDGDTDTVHERLLA